jgi:Protein of unknown function (DUF2630)
MADRQDQSDRGTLQRINKLVDEEHELLRRHGSDGLGTEEHERLEQLQVELDQCWDLLRQRRARREFGVDPDDAQPRSERTVEGYLQ